MRMEFEDGNERLQLTYEVVTDHVFDRTDTRIQLRDSEPGLQGNLTLDDAKWLVKHLQIILDEEGK